MSVLERLRKRSGLLVAIVGLALLAFVLTGLLEKGGSLFGSSTRAVGEIYGKSIEFPAFDIKVKEAIENQKRQQQKTTLTPEEQDQVVQQMWSQTINETVMNKEYEKLGLGISNEEIHDLMIDHPHSQFVRQFSDPQTGKVNQRFADPRTGQLSPAKIQEYVSKMTDEEEGNWIKLEDWISQVRTVEKYNNLIKKVLYIPTAFAKKEYVAQSSNANVKYVMKNYKSVADSTIKPTDAELDTYYKAHQNEFKQEASRKLEYIAFDVLPSQEDFETAKKNLEKVAEEFKAKKTTEDSSFVVAESDTRNFDMTFHTKGTLSPIIDSTMFKAEVGTVQGPYLENGTFKIAKLIASKYSADSGKVRHILIAYKGAAQAPPTCTRTKEQAKAMADSLMNLLKKKKGDFKDFVAKFSDDLGGKNAKPKPGAKPTDLVMGKDGEYGWVNSKSGFIDPFKNAALDQKKGEIVIAEGQFGYHIIEIEDSKGKQQKVQVATIENKVGPSSKTMQGVFVKASEFAGKNNTNELFQKAVIDQKLNKRIADNIKENDKTISGIESPRALIRWVYDNKKGTVSEPQEYGDKFIVGVITDVKEKGIGTMEEVKETLKTKVITEKKGAQFISDFNTAMASGKTIEEIGAKMKLPVMPLQNINWTSTNIPDLGSEPALVGTVVGMKAKALSKPIVGTQGIIVAYVDTKTDAAGLKDYKSQQSGQVSQIVSRADYEVYDALKQNAKVTEHLVRFY